MKKVIFLSFSIFLVFILSACGKQVQNNPNQGNFPKRPPLDFGQPETQPGLTGIVKSIVGNEVTILKIERPAGQGGPGEGMPMNQSGEQAASGNSSQEKKPSIAMNGGPQMGGGPGMGMRRNASEEEQKSMIEMFKEMSSGEEKVVIPVGIRMLKASDSGERREMVAATLEDIKQDSMLTIWLDETVTDRKIAKFVVIK